MRFLVFVLCLFPLPVAAGSMADEVLHFVMVDRFADGNPDNNQDVHLNNPLAFNGGDLQGLAANIDEIATLGATAI